MTKKDYIIGLLIISAVFYGKSFIDYTFNPSWERKCKAINNDVRNYTADEQMYIRGVSDTEFEKKHINHLILSYYDHNSKNKKEFKFDNKEIFCITKQTNRRYQWIKKRMTNYMHKYNINY